MFASLGRAVVLTLAGGALGLAVNAARSNGVKLGGFAAPVMCADSFQAAEELPPAQAAGLCGVPATIVADARSEARFAEGHVAGAIHLPCSAAGAVADDALARLASAHTIVVYGENGADAKPVTDSLKRRLPSARVVTLRGGFSAWSQSGQACASGACDECSARLSKVPE